MVKKRSGKSKVRGRRVTKRKKVTKARNKKAPKTTRTEWLNLGKFVLRYAFFVAVVLGASEGFRRFLGAQAPFELNFIYFPIFFLVVTGIFGVMNVDKLKRFAWSQNWAYSFFFIALGLWNIGTYGLIKYKATQAFAFGLPTAYLVLTGAFYVIGFALVGYGVFGSNFARFFQKELMLISIVAIPYVSLTFLLRTYWNIFSGLVTSANVWLMGFVTENVAHTIGRGDPTLALESFQVIIGAPCSGVDSLLLFTALYWFVGLLDFNLYNKTKLLILFPLGLIGTFMMSIIRIFLLMLVGAFYSPELALGAFHTNAGWVIFVIYFLTLMYFAMPWMKK